jgi:hypothetical protein
MGHIRAEAAFYFVSHHQHCVYGIKEQLLNFCPGENLKHLDVQAAKKKSLTSTY